MKRRRLHPATNPRPVAPASLYCPACASDREAGKRCPRCGSYAVEYLPARGARPTVIR